MHPRSADNVRLEAERQADLVRTPAGSPPPLLDAGIPLRRRSAAAAIYSVSNPDRNIDRRFTRRRAAPPFPLLRAPLCLRALRVEAIAGKPPAPITAPAPSPPRA